MYQHVRAERFPLTDAPPGSRLNPATGPDVRHLADESGHSCRVTAADALFVGSSNAPANGHLRRYRAQHMWLSASTAASTATHQRQPATSVSPQPPAMSA